MYLNDTKIKIWADLGGISPFDPKLINPASIDIRIGEKIKIPENFTIPGYDVSEDVLGDTPVAYNFSEHDIPKNGFLIQPGQFVLVHSLETIHIPEYLTGDVNLKSTSARLGLQHLKAGWIDPGFQGQIVLELVNQFPMPRILKTGMRICQLVLAECYPAASPYGEGGNYQYQTGVREAYTTTKKEDDLPTDKSELLIKITGDEAKDIIDKRVPLGLFYRECADGLFVGIDNATGDAWTEDFKTFESCRRWLRGEFEIE